MIKLSLQYAEVIELVKKNINEYNAIIIKTEDNHEGKSLKDLLLKEVIMLMMHNWIMPIRKKTEILNCKLFDISDGEPMMIKVTKDRGADTVKWDKIFPKLVYKYYF